jgi:hypothetical protein
MKNKQNLILKLSIVSLYLCVLISISSLILQEAGIKLLCGYETTKLDLIRIINNPVLFLSAFDKFSILYKSMKIQIEEGLKSLLGCILGRFIYLCLSSWVIGALFSFFALKKIHYHRIMKMGIY